MFSMYKKLVTQVTGTKIDIEYPFLNWKKKQSSDNYRLVLEQQQQQHIFNVNYN